MVLLTLTESKKCLIWFSSVTPLEAPESYSWIRDGDRNHWCSWNSQHRKSTFAINSEPKHSCIFYNKIAVIFMLLVYRIIHKQCLCMQKTWKCTFVKCCSRNKCSIHSSKGKLHRFPWTDKLLFLTELLSVFNYTK